MPEERVLFFPRPGVRRAPLYVFLRAPRAGAGALHRLEVGRGTRASSASICKNSRESSRNQRKYTLPRGIGEKLSRTARRGASPKNERGEVKTCPGLPQCCFRLRSRRSACCAQTDYFWVGKLMGPSIACTGIVMYLYARVSSVSSGAAPRFTFGHRQVSRCSHRTTVALAENL